MCAFVLPRVGQRVRLRDEGGRFDLLATVIDAAGVYVTLDQSLVARTAHVIFSSPDGPVQLTGVLVGGTGDSHLRVSDERRMQRRAAWRVRINAPATVIREMARPLECHALDVSLTGVMLGATAAELRPDERVALRIHVPDLQDLELTGFVVRRDGDLRAIALDPLSRAADAGLHRALQARQEIR
jgi:hypothetical protein